MNYFILNTLENSQQWLKIDNPRLFMKFKPYKLIRLYDEKLTPIGIGLY